ncbi:MAG: CRISPR-associated helicase Cas3', partial [Nanoarchaeota archaeon]|nr:CRISPR-associated helicase Cas3' [Nanoarchaeota archaeon]
RVRENAYSEVKNSLQDIQVKKDKILSINLPTGIGKTLAGLSFALELRAKVIEELDFTPKIVYALPFLSIIDQNSEVIKEIFKLVYKQKEPPTNLLLKHHHLTEIEYSEETENELNVVQNINSSLLLTEGWYSEVIVTTFIQLFHSLITNRNRAARKFHNIIDSIIILDEVQSIPTRYWLLIKEILMYMCYKFNCWVILMTATEPLIFEPKKEIKELVANKDNYFSLFNRYNIGFELNEKEFNLFCCEIEEEVQSCPDKDIMVVLNTIGACKKLYGHLKAVLSEKAGAKPTIDQNGICCLQDLELINLSTHILPSERLRKIERLRNRNKQKIIITTQLIEAGVDISADIVFRDMAPLDSLIQTAGRCNRNNEREGMVKIIMLKDERTKRAYHSYIYDSVLIDVTKKVINDAIQKNGNVIKESEFILGTIKPYYELLNQRKSKAESINILEHLTKLNFGDINQFQLIKEKVEPTTIFVEINTEAEELRQQIEKVMASKKSIERWENILILKKKISRYCLSLQCNKNDSESLSSLPHIQGLNDIRYIPRKEIANWYKPDSGFNFHSEQFI